MFNLYSRRKKDSQGNPEVFIYDNFPQSFRNQFFTILNGVLKAMRERDPFFSESIPEELCKVFAQEKGLKFISGKPYIRANSLEALELYIDTCSNEDFLDLMDFLFGAFISNERIQGRFYLSKNENFFQNAIDELNLRLKQHSLGYEFLNGEIIEKTNTITHEKIIKPALKLLTDEQFRGAEEEYLLAFEHFRNGNNEDAILNAIKSFESGLKTICSGMGYSYNKDKDTTKRLIEILKQNTFFPSYLDNYMNGICTTLESGASTVRNKTAGHGQGIETQTLPEAYVEYALNLVATNLVFLYRMYREKVGG